MHIFIIHIFKKIVGLGAEAHLNTCFKHFIYFVHEFKLIDPKELQPLKDLIDSLMGKEKEIKREGGGGGGGSGSGSDRPDRKSKKNKPKDENNQNNNNEKKASSDAVPPDGTNPTTGEKEKNSEKDKNQIKEGNNSPSTGPATDPSTTKVP